MATAASRTSFEMIAQRLLQAGPTLPDAARALGAPPGAAMPADNEPLAFKLAPTLAPFDAVSMTAFRGKVRFEFTLGAGPWRLADVVAEPPAWPAGPRLPTSGALEVSRSWLTERASLVCVVRLQGDGDDLERLHVDPVTRCLLTARKAPAAPATPAASTPR